MAGKLFEELIVGQVFQHQPGRTVTEADNIWFSCLTMNPQPLHVDFHAAQSAEFGKPLVNSLFTLGVAVGLSVGETTLGTTVGNLGFEKVEFPGPSFTATRSTRRPRSWRSASRSRARSGASSCSSIAPRTSTERS